VPRCRHAPRPAALAAGAILLALATIVAADSLTLAAPRPPVAEPSRGAAPAAATARPSLPNPNSTPQSAANLVPLVPIVSFWSDETSISLRALTVALGGSRSRSVAISLNDQEGLRSILGFWPQGEAMSPAEVRAFVRSVPGALGVVRAEDVTLDVRALAVDGLALFGVDRIADLGDWPLLAREPGLPSSFAPAHVWSLAAGGDVMLDKAVYAQSVTNGLGVDYAWDGSRALIDGRYCCGSGGKPLVSGHRIGEKGEVGQVFRDADLSLVNLESPEPDRFRYHSSGYVFTGDPALLKGLSDAGIDMVGLANNHLGNGGTRGVSDTIRHLDELGIAHAGAGANQVEARRPAWLGAAGLRVAVLAYCWVGPWTYIAAPGHPGSAMYSISNITRDIRAARAAGADVVIVMPHWGYEYTDAVTAEQRAGARAMIRAGADLVLGSHSHWVGPFEQVSAGHMAFYSLGDLVFDWTHDERTQEGAIAVLTFVGSRLVQIDLQPTLIIQGQPNLLARAGDGQAVLDPVHRSSAPLLGW
jgi:poly-gamma-glutamate capsule biosynthesis protein CapA/YwtB (metallophosphatase superfamily)